ncbi:MAG: RNA polymerase sigma-70 factor [bacterium]
MIDLPDSSDAELVRAIRSADAAAFKALYFRYYDALYRFLWQRTHSADLAKDFLQEVYTRLWQNRRNLDPAKSIKAYLYRIANNLVIDYIRKNAYKKSYLTKLSHRSRSFSEESIEVETSIHIALNNLPEKLRTVFMLSRYEGLTYSEIAEACHISVKTVESRMSRALLRLREELQ